MPRPKRARRAPAQSIKPRVELSTADVEPSSDEGHAAQVPAVTRGRKRTTRSTDFGLSIPDEQAIVAAARSRDAALDRLATEDVTTTSGNAVDGEDSGSSVEFGRRAAATPAQRRDTTGLDLLDDDMFGDLDDSFEDGDVPRGGLSTDTSSLNMSTFKRRPRQSSIIGRNDPPIRPSSRGGNTPNISSTLNIGVFRRRAREPSILGTTRKARPEDRGVEDTAAGPESDSESEEDFAPEAESTPLNNRRRTQPAPEVEREATPEQASNTKSRKRKSEDAVPSSDRPEKMTRLEVDEDDEDEDDVVDQIVDSDDESSLSSLSSPSGPPTLLPERPVTPFNDEDVAPPASSGSEGVGDVWPDIHTLAKRRRRHSVTTPLRAHDALSDVSSPPSLTHSPNFEAKAAPKTRGRAATRRQPSPKVTTADLTSMLPKRRYKKGRDPLDLSSEEEYDASGLAEDEDELSYLDTRAARRRKGSRPPSRGASRPGSRAAPLRPRQTPAPAGPAPKDAATYSRRSSDKENEGEADDDDDDEHEESRFQPLPDDTFDAGTGETEHTPSADELRQAARKFKEVDKWELEYEEVTQSSSPQGAR
ncbi:hypothetical protein G7046_g332 [Stylonectria norvegica]|nr:hypothetical protein G7046_g332 [Stylonectria norvegica]